MTAEEREAYYALLEREIELTPPLTRECGECRVCCTLFEVPEIPKEANVACEHLCAAGCKFHGTELKPRACRAFVCLYLDGIAHVRPAQSGVVGRRLRVVEEKIGVAPVVQLHFTHELRKITPAHKKELAHLARTVLALSGLADVSLPGFPKDDPRGSRVFTNTRAALEAYCALFPARFPKGPEVHARRSR